MSESVSLVTTRQSKCLLALDRAVALVDRFFSTRSQQRMKLVKPGMRHGDRPSGKSHVHNANGLDRAISKSIFAVRRFCSTRLHDARWLVELDSRVHSLRQRSSAELLHDRRLLEAEIRKGHWDGDVQSRAISHAVVAAEASTGHTVRWNQLLAARALTSGCFVELATGEGKTLSIAIAAGALALSGAPVHVYTANDYLAERDSQSMAEYFRLLGLSVSHIHSGCDADRRRDLYLADVVYMTAKQGASDWLQDMLACGESEAPVIANLAKFAGAEVHTENLPIMRGLCVAIVDEADSLLIDEGRIPFVLARLKESDANADIDAAIALGIAEQLQEGDDFQLTPNTYSVQLTRVGLASIASLSEGVAHVWKSSRYREERVTQALTAIHRYVRDRDYIVREGLLELVDAHTGRPTPDRRLPHGLQKLLELKERCAPTPEHETVATLPFHDFFQRYLDLVGASGSLREVEAELLQVYGRHTVHMPPHQASQLVEVPGEVHRDTASLLEAMVKELNKLRSQGRPVLIGTRTIEQSIGVSAFLNVHEIEHKVLNAYQDRSEAEIIATAGQSGSVTVATNMAGRGTDIPLSESVASAGGLHVMVLAFNDAKRLDRQLIGRVARHGQAGSFQKMYCLDDSNFLRGASPLLARVCELFVSHGAFGAAKSVFRFAQWRIERSHRRERARLYGTSVQQEKDLAFGGKQEVYP